MITARLRGAGRGRRLAPPLACAVAISLMPAGAARAADTQEDAQNLSSLSIEELSRIPVRSASKHDEPLSAAATALYVITDDDIARSNAMSLPEALRLAPNLHVERVNATQYAISARGFNGYEPSNKLLVLVDGRSVYSTLHSGVFWELRSPMLEDVQQIEVISGPGGTLYGPNAVNGVINVISKDASDTIGLLARATAGGRERTAAVRYGLPIGDSAALRVSGNYFDRERMPVGFGPSIDDAIRGWQAGFRADLDRGGDHATLQGSIFNHDTFIIPGDGQHGRNLLARWTHALGEQSSFQLQTYYDYSLNRSLLTVDVLETIDAEGQFNLRSGSHDLVAGLGVRTTRDQFINDLNNFQLDPQRARLWIWNGFVQDRFRLSPQVSLIAGVKLEGSTFTGVQVLPNLRVAWQPNGTTLFWAAASRAVRTPSRIDRNLTAAGILAAAPDFQSEKLVALEAGYRGQPGKFTSLSLSLFYNRYDDIRSVQAIGSPLPVQLANDLQGHTWGVELWGTQQLLPWWRLRAGASFLHKSFHVKPGGQDLSGAAALGRDPGYNLSLRSEMSLPGGFSLDADVRAVDSLENPHVDGYVEAGARLGWMASDKIELFVSGDNLLHAQHLESNDVQRTHPIARSVVAGARLRF